MLENLKILLSVTISLILINILQCSHASQYFDMPVPSFQVFENSGLDISIEDKNGIKEFSFFGSINREYKGTEQKTKDIVQTTTKKTNNKWVIHKKDVNLELGDVIYFMIFVRYEDVGFIQDDQRWEVDVIYDENGGIKSKKPFEIDEQDCQKSITRHLGKRPCRNKLIFSDDFSMETIAKKRWQIEKQIAQAPDFEFVTYDETNAFIAQNKLIIYPTPIIDEDYIKGGKIDFGDDCTKRSNSPACSRTAISYLILPPVNSTRILSAPYFTFRYGKIEFRAKLPEGDWIYPELFLIPKIEDFRFSENIQRILMAFATGNEYLQYKNDDLSSKYMKFGYFKYKSDTEEEFVPLNQPVANVRNSIGWNKKFHVFTVIWEPGRIEFQVDYETYGVMPLKNDDSNIINEYFIVFGVGVGGNTFFPEHYKSKDYPKPWLNRSPKAALNFWQNENKWMPTWKICSKYNKDKKEIDCPTALQIDYVKVWAL